MNISAKESLGYHERKKHNVRLDESCSELIDQGKEARLQWLRDPSEINADNLNDISHESRRHFRNK
jgi:hypothetical protein